MVPTSREELRMDDTNEILLAMYDAQVIQARHYDNLRSAVSGFLVAISAALVGLITFDGRSE